MAYPRTRAGWLICNRAAGCFHLAHARLVTDLVIVTAIPGTIGAMVFGLTFWSKARVQIGRRQLRYKAVRRVAGIVALACLPFIMMQRASIYLRSPREVVSEASEAYPDTKQWRMRIVVAIAHLEGDDGKQLEGRLRDALAGLDPHLHVTPVILNRTIAVSGRPQGIAHLEALGSVTDVRVEALIWGGAKGAAHPAVGPLYETMFGSDAQFGGAYLPADFKLPELPVDDLCTVLRLIVATQSAHFMQEWDFKFYFKFGDALEPFIKEVRAIADDPRKTSGWSTDTRARVNLVLGIANYISGLELESEDSLHTAIAYFQRTQADWTRERDPLEWAMVQQNLGFAMSDLAEHELQVAPLHAAVASYKDALAVYQARSDRLDQARVQFELGAALEKIGQSEAGVESLRQAADYYRAAMKGFDVRNYWRDWAETQRNLGNTVRLLADRDGSAKEYEDAIAADREALKGKCCNFENGDGGGPERNWAARSQAARSNSWSMN
jgi:tetratricopeptide (TPR) repeat protein